MELKQRFLRRLWLMSNDALILRELEFHRKYRDEENREGRILWRLDSSSGTTKVN